MDFNLTGKPLRLPLDLTGMSSDNFVENEVRELPQRQNRAIVVSYGPFFSESLAVYDNLTGLRLVKGEQYIAAQLVEAATVRTGKEVCGIVIVTDQNVGSEIRLTYQAVGGIYALSVDALTDMINAIDIDERPVVWGSIIGKPTAFQPGHHLHDSGDVYGFEYVVEAIEEVRKAILMTDKASHDELMLKIAAIKQEIIDLINANNSLYAQHIENFLNPHQTTKAQVGLGNVQNYTIASTAEAQAGVSNVKYMTPIRTAEAIATLAIAPLTAALNVHAGRTDNPHVTTAAQVGLGNVQNFGIATYADVQNYNNNNKYMTPYSTRQAINIHAASADHDGRYVPYASGVNGSLYIEPANAYIYIFSVGAWRQVWPAY